MMETTATMLPKRSNYHRLKMPEQLFRHFFSLIIIDQSLPLKLPERRGVPLAGAGA